MFITQGDNLIEPTEQGPQWKSKIEKQFPEYSVKLTEKQNEFLVDLVAQSQRTNELLERIVYLLEQNVRII